MTTPGRPWPRWRTVAEALGLADWELEQGPHHDPATRALHEHRSGVLLSGGRSGEEDDGRRAVVGVVGELDPTLVETYGLVGADGRPRRVGWLDLDLDVLLDPERTARTPLESAPVSRFPSSDIDLAFVVPDEVPAARVETTLAASGASCSSPSAVRRLPGGGARRRGAQSGLPAPVLRPRPDAHRRGDRRTAGRLHLGGGAGPPGHPALSRVGPRVPGPGPGGVHAVVSPRGEDAPMPAGADVACGWQTGVPGRDTRCRGNCHTEKGGCGQRSWPHASCT